jgi:hypothetical protein
MEIIKRYFGKLLSFLRVRTVAGGLEISDQVLRLAYFDRGAWQTAAAVLGPSVMERGVIKDPAAFSAALLALRSKVRALRSRKRNMNVVVSLSSASIYTQSFTLPQMGDRELGKAIDLNIQMSSPDDLQKSYFGSEVLNRDDEHVRLEIAAAFIDRQIVDDIIGLLFSAGLIAVFVESRALSLARIVREHAAGIDLDQSYLLLDVDNAGIDFLVLRKGHLYFEYSTPWADIADDKGQVAVEKFNETIAANLRQVMNFYHQHWQDVLSGVIVSSVMSQEEVQSIAQEVSALPALPLTLSAEQEIPPEWFVAFGAGLRGAKGDMNDKEINLAGEGAADAFRKEQAERFLELWQVLVPAALGILVITLWLAYNFLVVTQQQLAAGAVPAEQSRQDVAIAALQASSTAFNQDVQVALAVQSHADKSHKIIDEVYRIAASSSVNVSSLAFQGASSPIALSGVAATEDDIVEFKDLIEADPNFGPANLPLSDIQPSLSAYSFSITFPLAEKAFQ